MNGNVPYMQMLWERGPVKKWAARIGQAFSLWPPVPPPYASETKFGRARLTLTMTGGIVLYRGRLGPLVCGSVLLPGDVEVLVFQAVILNYEHALVPRITGDPECGDLCRLGAN